MICCFDNVISSLFTSFENSYILQTSWCIYFTVLTFFFSSVVLIVFYIWRRGMGQAEKVRQNLKAHLLQNEVDIETTSLYN
jgi:hypothetical protein